MKFIKFAAVTVAFIASVSAKLGFGFCPDVPTKTWDDYSHASTGFAKDQFYYHDIIAFDKQLHWIIEMAQKFQDNFLGFNIACDDITTILPGLQEISKGIFDAAEAADASQTKADGKNFNWPDKEVFEKTFPPTNDIPSVKLVDFKTTKNKEAEFYFICYDAISLFMQLNYGPSLAKTLLYNIIKSPIWKMLNLTLKFEVGVIVGPRLAGAADVTALQTAFGSTLANYPWSNLKFMEKAACPAL